MSATKITARGVKARLARAGVDYSHLTITERIIRIRRVDFDFTGPWCEQNEVAIEGPKDERRAAFHVLFDAGFACAPYPDHDEWRA